MNFISKSFLQLSLLCWVLAFFSPIASYAQGNPKDNFVISRDSMQKYWIEMLDNGNFFWTGIGVGLFNPNFRRYTDEVNFIPKKKNDVYTLRLRISYSRRDAGFPAAYTREISTMYGKAYKGYRFMATGSVGLSYLWGRKWIEEIATVTTPRASGLRQTVTTAPFYSSEEFRTIGVPLRAQAFLIAGKEFAFGLSLGTTLNTKQITGDMMFTFLLGIN